MAESKRDKSIGAEWLAWYALQGDEPPEFLGLYLDAAAPLLGEYIARERKSIKPKDKEFLSALHLVLIGLASAAKADGNTALKIDLKRVRRGKPIDTFERARIGHKAARIVEAAVSGGIKKEAAIAQATAETGLSRAEIFSWLRHRRHLADPEWRERLIQSAPSLEEQSGQFDE
jgi:hypothetical protein